MKRRNKQLLQGAAAMMYDDDEETEERQYKKQHTEEKQDDHDDIKRPAVEVDDSSAVVEAEEYGWMWGWRKAKGDDVVVWVDEQMSWGGLWFPYWDVDFHGEDYLHALYSDVWDDCIW